MITKLLLLVKKYALTLLVTYLLTILVLSFISLGDVEIVDEDLDDKIFHAIAYFVMTMLYYNYASNTKLKPVILITAIFCFCYGLAIEFFQPILNTSRVFDLYDIAANTLGIVFAVVVIIALKNKVKIN